MAPACRRMWGIDLPMPPCQAFAQELQDYRDFPPTCECLAECHALNIRVVYVDNCVNASQMHLRAQRRMLHPPPRAHAAGEPPCW